MPPSRASEMVSKALQPGNRHNDEGSAERVITQHLDAMQGLVG